MAPNLPLASMNHLTFDELYRDRVCLYKHFYCKFTDTPENMTLRMFAWVIDHTGLEPLRRPVNEFLPSHCLNLLRISKKNWPHSSVNELLNV